ncbi:MAG: tetratricopeptide repeat protein [Candidatus Omnitrophota bacterium]|jgi:hypothetical protein|nr:MAG: tetratricopeptide repeat protein [Candidatus Omnitrophota bacterium]
MFNLYKFIPFLISPFLFPGMSERIRFFAFLVLSLSCGIGIYLIAAGKNRNYTPSSLSPLHLVVWAGILFLYWGIHDLWPRCAIWTGIAAGGLILFNLTIIRLNHFIGFGFTIVVLWVIVGFSNLHPFFFSHSYYSVLIDRFFPITTEIIESDVTLTSAISVPRDQSFFYLFQMTLISTTTFLFAIFYHETIKKRIWIRCLCFTLIVVWILGLCITIGNATFVLVGIHGFLFYLFSHRMSEVFSMRGLSVLCGTVLLMIMGMLDYLQPVIYHLSKLFESYNFSIPPFFHYKWLDFGVIGPFQIGFESNSFQQICVVVIGIGFLLLVLDKNSRLNRTNLFLPMGISIFVICILLHFRSPVMIFSNPLIWLSISALTGAYSDQEKSQTEENSLPCRSGIILASFCFCIFLILIVLHHSRMEWRAETALDRYTQGQSLEERYLIAEKAIGKTPYRPDLAALYATTMLQTLVYPSNLPSLSQLQRLDHALIVSARKRYIPFLAYKRLSDLYFIHSNTDQSLQVLIAALKLFPEEIILHEWLGDRFTVLGRHEEAITQYRQSINLNPSSIRLREKMIAALKSGDKREEYHFEMENLLRLDPANPIN